MKTQYFAPIIIIVILIAGISFYFLQKSGSLAQSETKQAQEIQQPTKPEDNQKINSMGLGYIFKNGQMMVEDQGKFSPMTEEVTLNDGSKVSTSGDVTKKDGSKFTLAEGQSVWTDGTFMKEEAMMGESGENDTDALASRYVDYSQDSFSKASASNKKPVLFFAALKWCPSCQAADRDFKVNFSQVPKDVTILKVDYDTAKELKQKYAITMQDTFVQVDSNGKEITRWSSGGQGTSALLANLK